MNTQTLAAQADRHPEAKNTHRTDARLLQHLPHIRIHYKKKKRETESQRQIKAVAINQIMKKNTSQIIIPYTGPCVFTCSCSVDLRGFMCCYYCSVFASSLSVLSIVFFTFVLCMLLLTNYSCGQQNRTPRAPAG